MTTQKSFLYGPVPSRRLGLSLGVDFVPFKSCSLDCIYCQLGRTTLITTERTPCVPIDPIIDQLKTRIRLGLEADYITIGGSGEPTLNSNLGSLIRSIKQLTDIPVALLTNGALFFRPDVRADAATADVVLPSLDAADQPTFEKINRPHPDITIEKLIDGLVAFRRQYTGQIWLEVFLIDNVNTAPDQIAKIADAIKRIHPDKVQLNTAVRPTAQPGLKIPSLQSLRDIAGQLAPNAEVIADFQVTHPHYPSLHKANQDILEMLKRRPCSVSDITAALGITQQSVMREISSLLKNDLIRFTENNGVVFYHAK